MKPYFNSISEADPHRRLTRLVGRTTAALAILLLVVAGCSRLDIEGPTVTNQAPQLILVNVPAGGTEFSANPVVYWFGTDIDGRITRYDYSVLPESTVQRLLEEKGCPGGSLSDAERFIQCADDEDFQWTSVFVDSVGDAGLPTERTVNLFAAFDTLDCDSQLSQIVDVERDTVYFESHPVNCISKSIPQYMFIRAIDDLAASSQIKYRSYLRNNHWPETQISPDFELRSRTDPYFSLPELTQTYRGILVTWQGSDRQDFLRDEPPLEFYWRVFGPYSSPPTLADTLDPSGERLQAVQESHNSNPRKGVWVSDTLAYMYNLWNLEDAASGAPDTSRTGWFGLVVSSRDDAYVPDPSPDFVAFRAIDPKFERDVLLLSHGIYNPNAALAIPTCTQQIAGAIDPSCCHEFWKRIGETINQVSPRGWEYEKDWAEVNEQNPSIPPGTNDTIACRLYNDSAHVGRPNCYRKGPTLDVLARHRLVMYNHEDMDVPTSKGGINQILAQYLDIGGMIWLIDRIPFLLGTEIGSGSGSRIIDFTSDPDFRGRWPTQYFDIEGLWFPAWRTGLSTDATRVKSNDEFIGAYLESGFSSLPGTMGIDKEHLDSSYVRIFRTALASQSPPKYIYGIPGVPFVLRGSQAKTVYRFNSWRPELNNAQGAVAMTRFVGPSRANPKFKTAWFGCPLYFIQEEDAKALVAGMLDWFLIQPLEVL
jgi:hypothetical protein